MNLNQIFLAGHLTRDVELRYLPKGTAIASFSLAINRTWKDESGAKKEEVTFVECTAFGRQAETLGQYCKKGSPLFVAGRLRTETWDDKTTQQKRSKLSVVCENFQFIGDGKKSDAPAPSRVERPPTPHQDAPVVEDLDVPFL